MIKLSNPNLYQKKIETINIIASTQGEVRDYSLTLNFHEVALCIKTNSKNFYTNLKSSYPADWFLNYSRDAIEIFLTPPNLYFEGDEWDQEAAPDCFFTDNITVQRDFCVKKIHAKKYELMCEETLDDGFYNFLRWLLPNELVLKNQILVHSGAVRVNELGFMFLGHSGAGKSTTCTNLHNSIDAEVLNDDMNIIQIKEGDIFIKPAAMGGVFPCDKKHLETPVKLKNIFWLKQDQENKIEKYNDSKLCSKLIASFANLEWSQLDLVHHDKIIDFASHISKHVRGGELSLRKSHEFWEEIEKFN